MPDRVVVGRIVITLAFLVCFPIGLSMAVFGDDYWVVLVGIFLLAVPNGFNYGVALKVLEMSHA